MKNLVFGILTILLLSGCVSKSDYEKLQAENNALKIELDELQNGEERLIAKVNKAYKDRNYTEAKLNISLLATKHPESPKNEEFVELSKTIAKIEMEQNKKLEEERKEKARIENLNNTGIWSIDYYVDDFGQSTDKAFITNSNYIQGHFSNTATQNSDLNITFLITNSNKITIMLYEYAGNNPVKSVSEDKYRVLIQDNNGKKYRFIATNWSDRLYFDESTSKQIHNILLKGGTIKFKIIEIDTPTTEYDFTIDDANWYDNAYQKLKRIKKG